MSDPTTPETPSDRAAHAHARSIASTEPLELMHPDDQAAVHRRIIVTNEARTRFARAKANRARGLPAPVVGNKLFVTCVRGIPRRGRAGLRFDPISRREVEVVDLDPVELAARQLAGASVVDVDGAERILEDESLIVYKAASAGDENANADQLRAENQALRAQLAAARHNAPADPGDGSSSRLKAAQKVRDGSDFGSSK